MKSTLKKIIKIIGIIIGALLALAILFIIIFRIVVKSSPALQARLQMWYANDVVNSIKRAQDAALARAAKDTIGGQTPQETLQLYIDAVEKGDYEMASKYFVIDKQSEELESLKRAPKKNIETMQDLLKTTLQNGGGYSAPKNEYFFDRPISTQLILYPKGNWKIVRI
ncbi:MAG: hypothetical protein EXS55_02800 [Candidatus Magasanikbacteria bacterium]|nr:hypothetical protein [Candidatus Magasanikbacteria bacterium]